MSNEAKQQTMEQVAETLKLADQAAADYCKAKGITAGLTGKQHAGILVTALVEFGWLDEANKQEAWVVLNHLANASALRQRLEKAKVLGVASAIADSYV